MRITETERLYIEEATTDDSGFFFTLLNSHNWIQYIGDRNIKSVNDALNYISTNLVKSYKDNGFGFYKVILKNTNQPIGICGFGKRNYLAHPDIGFAILPDFEGQGLMYEAAKSMMNYGVSVLHLNPILATTSMENIKSQTLLHKLGLHPAGTIQPDDNELLLLLYST